jgi:hypothetical protein
VWGDPVDGAHQEARMGDVGLIVYPVEWYHRMLDYWPGGLTWRLVREAPCAVLLARIPRGRERAPSTRPRPTLRSSPAR